MTDNSVKKKGGKRIQIDYDNVDVQDIMSQIQENLAGQAEVPQEAETPADVAPRSLTLPELPEPQPQPVPISKSKGILLKLMRPFAPLIKLLILPVQHEFMESVYRLDFTNRRLDHLNQKMEMVLESLSGELYRSTDHLSTKLDTYNDALNQRLDLAFHDLGKAMEYTKLLHSLSHNLVVEMSKLKIEEEGLKVKARILEKDFEFLNKRERALEEQVFK
jgi:hypothetical protein